MVSNRLIIGTTGFRYDCVSDGELIKISFMGLFRSANRRKLPSEFVIKPKKVAAMR